MNDEVYIRRCFELARCVTTSTQSNPQVGAVLVYNDLIIGEGYYKQFGGPHAEVAAINDVAEEYKQLIKESTLYVSLEPCCIHAKTPACTDLIIKCEIPNVVISCLDPNPLVAGSGIRLLEAQGIQVKSGILEQEGQELIRPFVCHLQGRPFITLKWAKSKDHFIGHATERIKLSNPFTDVKMHQLRSQNDGILIGTNTAVVDNPQLTTRHYDGLNPLRIVLDREARVPHSHYVYDDEHPTLIITQSEHLAINSKKSVLQMDFEDPLFLKLLLEALYARGIHRLLIEGGAKTLKSFIKIGAWDNAYVIHTQKILKVGIKAPLIHGKRTKSTNISADRIDHIINPSIYS